MIWFGVFIFAVAVCLILSFGLVAFLNNYREWGLEFDAQCFLVGLSGAVPLVAGMVLADSHSGVGVSLLLFGPAIVGVHIFIFGVAVITCVAGAAFGRWAQRLGTRANQVQAEYTFHRNMDNE